MVALVRHTGPVLAIPPVLARNVVLAWGADGQRWLDRLPTLIADVARDWDLELGQTVRPELQLGRPGALS